MLSTFDLTLALEGGGGRGTDPGHCMQHPTPAAPTPYPMAGNSTCYEACFV